MSKHKENEKLVRRVLPYYKKYLGILILDLFCASLTVVCEMVLPLLVRYITNMAMTDIEALTVNTILIVGALYISLRIIDVVSNFFMLNQGHVMGARMENDMRTDLFRKFNSLGFDYYDNHKVGQLTSRITTDLFDITEVAHHCPEEFFIAGLKMVISFGILASFNIELTLILYAVIPVMIISGYAFKKRIKKFFVRRKEVSGEINSQVEDTLLGIRVVQSFVGEDKEMEKFTKNNLDYLDVKKDTYKGVGQFISVIRIFESIMYVMVLVLGGIFLIKGKIDAGDFVAYLLYVTTLLASVRTIIQYLEQFENGMSSVKRFYEIMDIEPTIKGGDFELRNVEGVIEFKDVSFGYKDNSNVLEGLNLKINKGENVAIVGPSGSGKTTLCNLIPRFYDVKSGMVTLDGVDVTTCTLESLRRNIGVVQQDVYLFSGTVYDNIAYGKNEATYDEVIAAAKRAGIHDFVMELPNGYDTYVGERGVKLSGGQKQRISLARVFLKNPPILILDEATSALDNESEKVIEESLDELSIGRTTLTIAHRLTTIKNSDRIIVLTNDGIAEEGSHSELMEKKGIYYDLYRMYID